MCSIDHGALECQVVSSNMVEARIKNSFWEDNIDSTNDLDSFLATEPFIGIYGRYIVYMCQNGANKQLQEIIQLLRDSTALKSFGT